MPGFWAARLNPQARAPKGSRAFCWASLQPRPARQRNDPLESSSKEKATRGKPLAVKLSRLATCSLHSLPPLLGCPELALTRFRLKSRAWPKLFALSPIRVLAHAPCLCDDHRSKMKIKNYVPLHVHSALSIGTAICRIPALIQRAQRLGFRALALTDAGNLGGALEFALQARAAGTQPLM